MVGKAALPARHPGGVPDTVEINPSVDGGLHSILFLKYNFTMHNVFPTELPAHQIYRTDAEMV